MLKQLDGSPDAFTTQALEPGRVQYHGYRQGPRDAVAADKYIKSDIFRFLQVRWSPWVVTALLISVKPNQPTKTLKGDSMRVYKWTFYHFVLNLTWNNLVIEETASVMTMQGFSRNQTVKKTQVTVYAPSTDIQMSVTTDQSTVQF